LKDALVTVEQTRHAFLFGCNIFLLDATDSSIAQEAYRDRFSALFNYATLPFYWGAFEKERGKPQYEKLEMMARWCAAHGIITKGHPLIWQEAYPKWAPADADAAIPLLRERVAGIITRYKGLINTWDVVNEANAAADFNNGEGRWVKRDGAAAVVRTALAWAREAGGASNETLIYNDYDVGPKNVALLSELASTNSLPDVIGLQSHMHQETWPLARAWGVCETFSQFRRPLDFTETTVISGPRRQFNYGGPPLTDWLTTPDGEARQADYVEKFYTLLFSHQSVRAITWWDFSDDRAWLGAPSGLLRRDMTPKPAYDKLIYLIRQKWWTKAAGKTDASGSYQTRAFIGSYRIKVIARGKTRTVSAEVMKNEDGDTAVTVSF
jgi:GH35 family endo-1,4-beta-xylanase